MPSRRGGTHSNLRRHRK